MEVEVRLAGGGRMTRLFRRRRAVLITNARWRVLWL